MLMFLPECTGASFALIVSRPLWPAISCMLSASVCTGVSNQNVNVVAGHYVIKYGQTEALLRFEPSADTTANPNFLVS
jgi:hypothetical protein